MFLSWKGVNIYLKRLLNNGRILERGHELGNHTYSHMHGSNFSVVQWRVEIQRCTQTLVDKLGINKANILGFRVPYIEHNSNLFYVLKQEVFVYDMFHISRF